MEVISSLPTLAPRRVDAHKGDFGRVLVVAGSLGMTGAAALAGRAALRAGAGLVCVATSRSALPIVAGLEPCFTTMALPEDSYGRISAKALGALLEAVEEYDVIVLGPGLGTSTGLREIAGHLVSLDDVRLLIDADGLNNLSGVRDWPGCAKAHLILTPHPGEMKRLWSGLTREVMPADRQELCRRFTGMARCTLVLKGAGTIVTDGLRMYINDTGNPGMATAGSGDVLTGVIAALMGQGLSNLDAAILGTYVHGLAGDRAARDLGQVSLMASDVLDYLPKTFLSLQDHPGGA